MRLPWWAYLLAAVAVALMVRGAQAIIQDGLWIWHW
jgi:hypothetical protein